MRSYAVPRAFRPVAWLHHARDADVTTGVPIAVALTMDEMAAIAKRLDGARPSGETLSAARLLPDPGPGA